MRALGTPRAFQRLEAQEDDWSHALYHFSWSCDGAFYLESNRSIQECYASDQWLKRIHPPCSGSYRLHIAVVKAQATSCPCCIPPSPSSAS